MTDKNKNELESSPLIQDEYALKDTKAPSRLPWILAAIVIVLVVMAVQLGARYFMQKFTHKKESHALEVVDGNGEYKALPMPMSEKKNMVQPPQSLDVAQYIKENRGKGRKTNPQADELAEMRLRARIEEHRRKREEEEAMIQSPALLNIGVGSSHPQKSTNQQGGNHQGNYQDNPNVSYLKSVSNQSIDEVNAGVFGDLRYRIRKGKILRGVTESAIDSDLPGMIRGHLTADVYGDQGDLPLMPNGSGLIGEYRSGDIKNGQVSLYVVWTRVQLPNGIYVNLDSSGSDPLGRSGMTGPINHHYMQRYGASLLTSIVSAGAATWGVNANDRYNSEAAYRQGLSNSFAQTANQELQKNTSIQNTIMPPQGTEISIIVNKDISFEDVLSERDAS